MPEIDSITFTMPKSLKERFSALVEERNMNMSYVLRQLMVRFIEDPTILVVSKDETIERLELEVHRLIDQNKQFMSEFQPQIEYLLNQYEKQSQEDSKTQELSLIEEIVGILKEDHEIRGHTYQSTEKAILRGYPQLKERVYEVKQQGEDPITDAIGIIREEGLVKYSPRNKRLYWKTE